MTCDRELSDLLKSLRRISHSVDVQSRRLQRAFGLTLPQLVVLRCVLELGEVTSRAISEEANLSAATVVGILDKLEAKGLINRYRSVRDRRIVHTRLTPAGKRILNHAPSALGEDFTAAFAGLSSRERRSIVSSIERVAEMISG